MGVSNNHRVDLTDGHTITVPRTVVSEMCMGAMPTHSLLFLAVGVWTGLGRAGEPGAARRRGASVHVSRVQ